MVPPHVPTFLSRLTRLGPQPASWCPGSGVLGASWASSFMASGASLYAVMSIVRVYSLSSLSSLWEGLAQFLQNPKIQKSNIFEEMVARSLDFWNFGFLEFWIFGFLEFWISQRFQKSKIPKIQKSKLRSTISSKILDFWIFGFTGNCDCWHGHITLLFPDAVSTLSVRVLVADLAHDWWYRWCSSSLSICCC